MKNKIKGTDYDVKFVKNFGFNDAKRTLGVTNIKDKTIKLLNSLDFEESCSVIVHELFHAYFYECGLIDEYNNEDLVLWLEMQFFHIFDSFVDIFKFRFPKFKKVIKDFELAFTRVLKKTSIC